MFEFKPFVWNRLATYCEDNGITVEIHLGRTYDYLDVGDAEMAVRASLRKKPPLDPSSWEINAAGETGKEISVNGPDPDKVKAANVKIKKYFKTSKFGRNSDS